MSLTRGRELPIGARAGLLDPKHVKAMGSARWLYDWILWRVTSEQDGVGRVLGGSPVRCEEIAADLGVGLRTVYRWMDRLRGRYIRTRHVVRYGRHGLAIEVLRSKKFHPGKPRANSNISTISTGNPAKTGGHNPARFGRNNPAKSGSRYKEERKPFRESYGKWNFDSLEDLPGSVRPRKTNPPSPPDVENENQNQNQEQEASQDAWVPGVGVHVGPLHRSENPHPSHGEGWGTRKSAVVDSAEREILAEVRRMVGAKALPKEGAPGRREMLERQRKELLERSVRRCLPP